MEVTTKHRDEHQKKFMAEEKKRMRLQSRADNVVFTPIMRRYYCKVFGVENITAEQVRNHYVDMANEAKIKGEEYKAEAERLEGVRIRLVAERVDICARKHMADVTE